MDKKLDKYLNEDMDEETLLKKMGYTDGVKSCYTCTYFAVDRNGEVGTCENTTAFEKILRIKSFEEDTDMEYPMVTPDGVCKFYIET